MAGVEQRKRLAEMLLPQIAGRCHRVVETRHQHHALGRTHRAHGLEEMGYNGLTSRTSRRDKKQCRHGVGTGCRRRQVVAQQRLRPRPLGQADVVVQHGLIIGAVLGETITQRQRHTEE